MTLKLIALDVDGTILTDDRKVQESTIKAVNKAKEAKAKIVITTGRPLVSTLSLLKKFNLDEKDSQYVINLHGAIVETTKGGIISDSPISINEIIKVASFIKKYPEIDFMIQSKNQIYVLKKDLNYFTAFESFKNHLPIHFRTLTDIETSDKSFYKLMFAADKNKLDELTSNLPSWIYSELKTMRSETCYIDMVNRNVDKGKAIENLASNLHISSDEIMAIGDGNSDIPMIKYAKYGIAMGNATPDLLKEAYDTTTDNNNDGVANAINKYL